MSVQLIIDGTHITDVLAQVQQLAAATSGDAPKNEAGANSGVSGSTTSAPSKPAATSTEASATGGKTKGLSREEQDAAVEAMVEQGFKDPRFDQLTKGRQTDVEKRLKEKDAAEDAGKTDDDLGGMFDDDDADKPEEVTAQTVRDLMGKLGKDAEGNQNQDNLLKIRDILVKHIPKGEEVKVGKIPEGKLAAVYAEMKKLDA
jgi:hypothetical protein